MNDYLTPEQIDTLKQIANLLSDTKLCETVYGRIFDDEDTYVTHKALHIRADLRNNSDKFMGTLDLANQRNVRETIRLVSLVRHNLAPTRQG